MATFALPGKVAPRFMESQHVELWFVIAGALLIGMALINTFLHRLPLTSSMLYLGAGVILGPIGFNLFHLEPLKHTAMLERVAEIAVIISLFTSGLKLRAPANDALWKLPLRLASVSMIVTVGLITLIGVTLLKLPLGGAVLLGAILAPTDPVLASDVQVSDTADRDRLRFSLTGEAGLNDGTAFPFVMLGLGLLGLHELGEYSWRWWAIDVAWACVGGIGIGAISGNLIGRLVLYLRKCHREAVGLDDFLALGLIAFSYGAALLLHAYGFLAVFAAGYALRAVERRDSPDEADGTEVENALLDGDGEKEIATHPEKAPAYMARALLSFNEQIERIGEVAVVLLLGGMLARVAPVPELWWLVPLLFLGVRPLAVQLGLFGSRTSRPQRALVSWFGIRGIGSMYYLMYAIEHGVPEELANRLVSLTFAIIAISVVVHGVSVTPLMNFYAARSKGRAASAS